MNSVYVILTLCLSFLAVSTHKDEHTEMCQHLSDLSDLYAQQCARNPSSSARRTIIGAPGKRGGIGPSGPPGSPGIVNYEKVDQKIATATNARMKKLEQQLKSVEEKLSQIEQKLNSTTKVPNCDLMYREKCFRAIVHDKQDVSFAAAETMCNNLGWKLANIYSKQLYDRVAEYLRNKVAPKTFMNVWLGMTYDPNTKKMSLADGTRFTEKLPWFPSYPKSDAIYNKMGIQISKDSSSNYQGIYNDNAGHDRRGALCET